MLPHPEAVSGMQLGQNQVVPSHGQAFSCEKYNNMWHILTKLGLYCRGGRRRHTNRC